MGLSSLIKEFRKAKSAINSFKGTLAKLKSINYEGIISSDLLQKQYNNARENLENRSKFLKKQITASNSATAYGKRQPSTDDKQLTYPLSEPINNSIGFIIQNFDTKGIDKELGKDPDGKTGLQTKFVDYDIQLYIPDDSIVSGGTVSYTKKGFGPGVRLTDQLLRNLTSLDGAGAMKTAETAASVISDRVIDMLTGGYANFKYGRARNPMEEMLLEGIEFRTHSFTFTFFPKNERESDEVRQICHVFRQTMLPSTYDSLFRGGKDTAGKYLREDTAQPFFRYPHQFQLEWRGPIAKNIEGFLPCFLTDCTIKHSGSEFGYYDDGTPLFTTLTLEFQEKELLTYQNYRDNVAPKVMRGK